MALIKCSECGREVSDRASACPNCGNPLTVSTEDDVVTIQVTQKRWKLWKLISALMFIIGFMFLINGFSGNGAVAGFGGLLIFLGFITALIAKFGAWWTTG